MSKIEEKIYCIYQREWEILMEMAEIKYCFGLAFQEEQPEKETKLNINLGNKEQKQKAKNFWIRLPTNFLAVGTKI